MSFSFLTQGIESQLIEVQVHTRFQIPSFQILGLAGPEIQEAKERIIAAFASSEIEFPKKKIIVNLAPSDLKKSGTGHDLAMAIAIMSIHENLKPWIAWGALGLDGQIKPCGKIASLLDLLCEQRAPGILYLSPEDADDFRTLETWRRQKNLPVPRHIELRQVSCLRDVLQNRVVRMAPKPKQLLEKTPNLLPLLPHQERLLDLSIVGRHHTLILGPKGVGKSQMLEWYRWISPESDPAKTWKRLLYEDHSKNRHSLAQGFPLRSVHSQVKPAHLLGSWGRAGFRAGELSLAHGGILIADEFLEWARDAKECLREPLQNKRTTITRVQGTSEVDCDFQLIATGNLCPCGGLPVNFLKNKNTGFECTCHPREVKDYLQRLSGPIADRIDLISIFNQEINADNTVLGLEMSPDQVRQKKERILERQRFALEQFGGIPGELSVSWLEKNLPKDKMFEQVLREKAKSLRSRHKIMRIARTIQAIDLSPQLRLDHLMEAAGFRVLEP